MTIEYVHSAIIPAAFSMLPGRMDSPEAEAMILAIGAQESGFTDREQMQSGPARGFWQFERGAVNRVLAHETLGPIIKAILPQMAYKPWDCYDAIQHNDVLACIFARLLLWTHPAKLTEKDGPGEGWAQYLETWRPGKPRVVDWPENFGRAWQLVEGAA
jgi:hypothetical protein